MNHTLILRRSFTLVGRYRILWILGILLALTAGAGRGSSNFTMSYGDTQTGPVIGSTPGSVAIIAGVVVALLCLALVLVVVGLVVRYVSQAGLYRSVEQIEDLQEAPKLGQALRLGWNFRAVRLFLIDLLVGIPFVIAAVLLFMLALSPLLLLLIDSEAVRIFSGLMTVGLVMLAVIIVILAGVVLNLLKEFMHRAAVLDDRGVLDAIRHGVALVRAQATNVSLMWVLMLGVGLAYFLVMIPVFLFLGGMALLLGGGAGWLLYQLLGSVAVAWLVGAPIGLVVFVLPLLLIGGFYAAYRSTVWTLTYRDVRALAVQP